MFFFFLLLLGVSLSLNNAWCMNNWNMESREYNFLCVAMLKNTLATYGMLYGMWGLQCFMPFTLCCPGLFLRVTETHFLWLIIIDCIKIDYSIWQQPTEKSDYVQFLHTWNTFINSFWISSIVSLSYIAILGHFSVKQTIVIQSKFAFLLCADTCLLWSLLGDL